MDLVAIVALDLRHRFLIDVTERIGHLNCLGGGGHTDNGDDQIP